MAHIGTHRHDHEHGGGAHVHAEQDPTVMRTARGLWAVKWSCICLLATAAFQVAIVALSGSVALLADTIHNFADAGTALPLGIAFWLARRKPSKRFTYGLGRAEDLAGLAIVAIILSSAIVACYESVYRLFHPEQVRFVWAIAAAALVGFAGNEIVAVLRIRTGKEIGSAALVADGYHARTDGYTSLAVLVGAVGVWLGYPLADPVVGIAITLMILPIVWDSAKEVIVRMLDGVDPAIPEQISAAARGVEGVVEVSDVRARWLGHRLEAEVAVVVDASLSVEQGHAIATALRHELLDKVAHLQEATVHVDPSGAEACERGKRASARAAR